MSATPERAVPGAATTEPDADSIGALATDVADVVGAWAGLLGRELALAQRSLRWLLIGAAFVPVAIFSAWLSLNALFVVLAHRYTNSWLLALLLVTGMQLLTLAISLNRLQRWTRDLTLPQSRAALVRAMERMS